jgi:hypothetical protein
MVEIVNLLLECLQPLLLLLKHNPDRRLNGGRDLAPEFNRNRRNRLHARILRSLEAPTSSGMNGCGWETVDQIALSR